MPTLELKLQNGVLKYYGYLSTIKVGFRYADIDSIGLERCLFSLQSEYVS